MTSAHAPAFTIRELAAARHRRFDDSAIEYERHCADRVQDGVRVAQRDIELIVTLSDDIAATVARWSERVEKLDEARSRKLDPHMVAEMVIELLTDEALTPEAAAVLTGAVRLSMGRAK